MDEAITYGTRTGPGNSIPVYLGKRLAGYIISESNGHRYLPSGRSDWAGQVYSHINDCMESIEQ